MKILILTPIDAASVLITGQHLYNYYDADNDIFSIQTMAMLADHGENSAVSNHYFAAEVRDNPNTMLARNKHYKNLIVHGNCDKNTTKFDHIITWEQIWDDENYVDTELATQQDAFKQAFEGLGIEPIDWYTYSDAEYCFPDWDHLALFLKTLGVKSDGI